MSDLSVTTTASTRPSEPERSSARRLAERAGARRRIVERPITRQWDDEARGRRMRGRPELVTSYHQRMRMVDTPAKQQALVLLIVVALSGVWWLPDQMLLELATAFALAIGAIGLNIVTGYAGQVSLGHSFFLGLGAFTAAVIGGTRSRPDMYALEISELLVWLPAAGLVAAIAGVLVAPLALRLRGLYLAIVTLGLVFIGQYIFNQWDAVSGGEGIGRPAARPQLFGLDFSESGLLLGLDVSANQRMFVLLLIFLVIAAVVAKNIVRSDVGRSFAAVRDRDQAAEVIGVELTRTKVLAFTISSFYGGISGALLYAIVGVVDPASFGLTLAVLLLAMVLIGGAGTIAGGILGALFFTFLGTASQSVIERAHVLTDLLALSPAVLEAVLGGVILVLFLLFEPTGLFGIWQRARTYWKGWPFTY